jgi:hypothetical protein
VLEDREVDGDPEPLPETLLVADRPVRAAPDEIAQALGRLHQRDGHDAGRISDLQGAVDVEAHECHHRSSPDHV